ncbi:unnamed protein product [Adineta ricciae]|uniref:Uncharacterized protein n=1 Tax=Adineta ricciae TaxID=249248 RepID=A0A813U7D2_ADIRI|nr:unnamed protein product [Adineta ricciae]
MMPVVFLLLYVVSCSIHWVRTDLSILLSSKESQAWLDAVSQINQSANEPFITVVELGDSMEIPLYNTKDVSTYQNRHIFKQNINKRVDCYLFANILTLSSSANIYDSCYEALLTREIESNMAGIYVYTDDEFSSALGLIIVRITNSFQWFNDTKPFSFRKQPTIRNGTQLSLAFETMIYYNSNSDLRLYNQHIDGIVQQAKISINHPDHSNNLHTFFAMDKLSCQRHEQIADDNVRLLTLVCLTEVTFQCPLSSGSTCWIENKRMSNIVLNINGLDFVSDRTVTVRIDV